MIAEKDGMCVDEALKLRYLHADAGDVYFVFEAGRTKVGHAYYVHPELGYKDLAMNQADNGYGSYPALTVKEVVEYGYRLTGQNPRLEALLIQEFEERWNDQWNGD